MTRLNLVPQSAKGVDAFVANFRESRRTSNGRCSRFGPPENAGHSSRALSHTVITKSNVWPLNSRTGFERCPEISMPSSPDHGYRLRTHRSRVRPSRIRPQTDHLPRAGSTPRPSGFGRSCRCRQSARSVSSRVSLSASAIYQSAAARSTKERLHPCVHLIANASESGQPFRLATLDGSRTLEAPVHPLGAGRKHRTSVARVVANGHHVIEPPGPKTRRRTWTGALKCQCRSHA